MQGDPLRLGPRARKGSNQVIMNLCPFLLSHNVLYYMFASLLKLTSIHTIFQKGFVCLFQFSYTEMKVNSITFLGKGEGPLQPFNWVGDRVAP